ncbi:Wax synthase domain [Sesbania bispinosa]|nr:Wax synthase domain [Sesbania bispinosa]
MYIGLEFFFAVASTFTQKILRVQLEPQFEKPYLCNSLQDFWGKRWNLSVNRLLHPTVYVPVVSASSRVVGRKWAPLPAIVATFAVSAIMHELIFYYIKREQRTWEAWEPSWDATCFFLIHGVCLAIELGIKKELKGKWQLPRAISWPLTVVFIFYTTLWLFVPALVRCHIYEKATRELTAVTEFVKDVFSLSMGKVDMFSHHK